MMPGFALVMTLATINVPNDYFLNPRAILKPSLAGILMTYVILSGAILLVSALLIDDLIFGSICSDRGGAAGGCCHSFYSILEGMFLPLCRHCGLLSRCFTDYALMFWIFIGTGFDDPYKLVRIMLLLIVLPLVLSRMILYFNWQDRIAPVRGLLTDWGFFIVLYSIIGVNRDLIFSRPLTIVPVTGVVFATTFVWMGNSKNRCPFQGG